MPVPGFNRPGDGGGGLKLGDKLNFVNNLVAKSQPSTMSDSVQTLINKVANLGYVGSKRWASGSTSSGSQAYTLYTTTGATQTGYPIITVTGLSFTPSTIISWVGTTDIYTIYTSSYQNNGKPTCRWTQTQIFFDLSHAPLSVSNGSFTIPASAVNAVQNWIAFE